MIYATAGARRAVVALDAGSGEVLWMHREEEVEAGAAARVVAGLDAAAELLHDLVADREAEVGRLRRRRALVKWPYEAVRERIRDSGDGRRPVESANEGRVLGEARAHTTHVSYGFGA